MISAVLGNEKRRVQVVMVCFSAALTSYFVLEKGGAVITIKVP